MTKKDFFILIIKLFGLYSIITALFLTLPQNLSFVIADFGFASIIYLIAILTVLVALFALIIFKSHHIVRVLKLEKGFDDDRIDLANLKTTDIVKMATAIIGGLLIINNIPIFINQTFHAFYYDIQSQPITLDYKWNWLVRGLDIIIGYLLITNLNFIVRLLRIKSENEK